MSGYNQAPESILCSSEVKKSLAKDETGEWLYQALEDLCFYNKSDFFIESDTVEIAKKRLTKVFDEEKIPLDKVFAFMEERIALILNPKEIAKGISDAEVLKIFKKFPQLNKGYTQKGGLSKFVISPSVIEENKEQLKPLLEKVYSILEEAFRLMGYEFDPEVWDQKIHEIGAATGNEMKTDQYDDIYTKLIAADKTGKIYSIYRSLALRDAPKGDNERLISAVLDNCNVGEKFMKIHQDVIELGTAAVNFKNLGTWEKLFALNGLRDILADILIEETKRNHKEKKLEQDETEYITQNYEKKYFLGKITPPPHYDIRAQKFLMTYLELAYGQNDQGEGAMEYLQPKENLEFEIGEEREYYLDLLKEEGITKKMKFGAAKAKLEHLLETEFGIKEKRKFPGMLDEYLNRGDVLYCGTVKKHREMIFLMPLKNLTDATKKTYIGSKLGRSSPKNNYPSDHSGRQ